MPSIKMVRQQFGDAGHLIFNKAGGKSGGIIRGERALAPLRIMTNTVQQALYASTNNSGAF
jgi:hypothetical protein